MEEFSSTLKADLSYEWFVVENSSRENPGDHKNGWADVLAQKKQNILKHIRCVNIPILLI